MKDSKLHPNSNLAQNERSSDFEMEDLTEDEDLMDKKEDLENCSKPEERLEEKLEKGSFVRQYGGIVFTVLASLVFPSDIYIRSMLRQYGFNQDGSSILKYAGIAIFSLLILIYFECFNYCKNISEDGKKTTTVFGTVWPVNKNGNWKNILGLLVRSTLVSVSGILKYFILQHWTIADASIIYHSSPLLVIILARFLLTEKLDLISIIAALLTLIGVIVIAKPPLLVYWEGPLKLTLTGSAYAVGFLLCDSFIVIITRSLREVNLALMLFVYGFLGMIQTFAISYFLFGIPLIIMNFETVMTSLGVASIAFFGEMLVILGSKFEKAGPISSVRTSEFAFGILLAFTIHGIVPDIWRTVGSSVIITAVAIIIGGKCISTIR